jgi:hypothetical protein
VRDKHDDKLEDGRGGKDQEGPLDRPDASVRRGDGGVYYAMRMAVTMMVVVSVLAMSVPV